MTGCEIHGRERGKNEVQTRRIYRGYYHDGHVGPVLCECAISISSASPPTVYGLLIRSAIPYGYFFRGTDSLHAG